MPAPENPNATFERWPKGRCCLAAAVWWCGWCEPHMIVLARTSTKLHSSSGLSPSPPFPHASSIHHIPQTARHSHPSTRHRPPNRVPSSVRPILWAKESFETAPRWAPEASTAPPAAPAAPLRPCCRCGAAASRVATMAVRHTGCLRNAWMAMAYGTDAGVASSVAWSWATDGKSQTAGKQLRFWQTYANLWCICGQRSTSYGCSKSMWLYWRTLLMIASGGSKYNGEERCVYCMWHNKLFSKRE